MTANLQMSFFFCNFVRFLLKQKYQTGEVQVNNNL